MVHTPQQGDNDEIGEQTQAQQELSDTPQADAVIEVVNKTAQSLVELFKTGKIDAASW